MQRDVLAAMQEAIAEARGHNKPWPQDEVAARAVLPVLREAVEGMPRIPGYSRGLVPLDAVLALLADVQGDGDA